MRIKATSLLLLLSVFAKAQQVRPAPSPKIYHELAQMKHLVNVLYVAAHPDDENTRLLAWLVNNKNIRTGYLSLTRGDGGQNILGGEQGQALGLIRTHELMEARKIDGAEQYFSRAIDFGFSKNFDETFKHWNQDTLTGDAVWVMRRFRPDVVICRFPPNSQAGHGQHAASAIIAARAFKASGDKNAYPAQLKYAGAWQPKRILFNAFRFGSFNTTTEDMLKIKVGQYLPQIGMGAGELAGISRSVHKSQGAGTPSVPGEQLEYFKLVDGDSMTNSIFDGIDITWGRVGRKDIGEDINNIISDYDNMHPDASLPALLALRKKITTVSDAYWRDEKLGELDQVILDCSGFMAELYTKQPQAVAGSKLPFTLHVIARSKVPVMVNTVQWMGRDTAVNTSIGGDSLFSFEHFITIPADTKLTEPYWLMEHSANPGLYTVLTDTLLGLPETPDNLNALITLNIGGEPFKITVPLSYKKLDPVRGDVVEPLRIVPDVSLDFTSDLVIAGADGSVKAGVRLHPYTNLNNATLTFKMNTSETYTINGINLNAANDTLIQLPFKKVATTGGNTDVSIDATIEVKGKKYNKSMHVIQYNHIPTLQYFTDDKVKVVKNDWKCTAKKIGYIEGAGDFTATFLRLAGLQVDVLKDGDFADADNLKKYDAIITGIRAVNVEKKMVAWMPVLLKYAANGGTVVMQYNTLQDLATTKLGPFPITLSTERVTEEDAQVTFVNPDSRILNYPNKITSEDFNGWVQERGLYFATKWDDQYQPLFEMHDTGEKPLKGCTLYAKTGKGNYIYTTLSFSRQLPAGNKGAIRLLMNMLSVGK